MQNPNLPNQTPEAVAAAAKIEAKAVVAAKDKRLSPEAKRYLSYFFALLIVFGGFSALAPEVNATRDQQTIPGPTPTPIEQLFQLLIQEARTIDETHCTSDQEPFAGFPVMISEVEVDPIDGMLTAGELLKEIPTDSNGMATLNLGDIPPEYISVFVNLPKHITAEGDEVIVLMGSPGETTIPSGAEMECRTAFVQHTYPEVTPTPTPAAVTAEIGEAGGILSTGTEGSLEAGQIEVEIDAGVFFSSTNITAIQAERGLNLIVDCSGGCPETAEITVTMGVPEEPINPSISVNINGTTTNFPATFDPETDTVSSRVTLILTPEEIAALRGASTSSILAFAILLQQDNRSLYLPIVAR